MKPCILLIEDDGDMRELVAGHLEHSGFDVQRAEDGIRDLVRSRGLGDVYKRQGMFFGSRQGSFLGSSAVERSTVNRLVAGSNPARGVS